MMIFRISFWSTLQFVRYNVVSTHYPLSTCCLYRGYLTITVSTHLLWYIFSSSDIALHKFTYLSRWDSYHKVPKNLHFCLKGKFVFFLFKRKHVFLRRVSSSCSRKQLTKKFPSWMEYKIGTGTTTFFLCLFKYGNCYWTKKTPQKTNLKAEPLWIDVQLCSVVCVLFHGISRIEN